MIVYYKNFLNQNKLFLLIYYHLYWIIYLILLNKYEQKIDRKLSIFSIIYLNSMTISLICSQEVVKQKYGC